MYISTIDDNALCVTDQNISPFYFDYSNLEAEDQQMLNLWNNVMAEYPCQKTIHQLFEEQVLKTPDNIAVVFDQQSLTYQELNQKANQLAHYLQAQQISNEALIAICAERSLEMVIGILGILKAGAAYIPLDPHYPSARLSYMLQDSQATILLVGHSRLKKLLPNFKGMVFDLSTKNTSIRKQSKTNLEHQSTSKNLAYVMYTSGSTGNPKGVCVEHHSLNNHMDWMIKKYGFSEKDIFLQKTPFSFDASVWEFFAPLLCGGCLIMAPDQAHSDANQLIQLIAKHKVTVIQLVPMMLRELLSQTNLDLCQSLTQVFCGGEALPPDTIRTFLKKFQIKLHNLYGPTEATIDTTTISYDRFTVVSDNILIGKPINNTVIYVMDDALKPVPIGHVGELYIGGDCLSRGYLNQKALTDSKFKLMLLPNGEQQRIYKTGDMVRWLTSGNIEYLGRRDDQIKIGGCRVELGEVEACLLQYQDIHQCAVAVHEHSDEVKLLIAYLVLQPGCILDQRKIRDFLSGILPDHAIPNRFVCLKALPLMPNGKIDRTILPKIEPSQFNSKAVRIVGTNVEEQTLSSIWESVLAIENIGIHDNFFDLGGHSLAALRILSIMRNVFSVKLNTSAIFKAPTIAELAKLIRESRHKSTTFQNSDFVITLKTGEFKLPLFFIHPVGGTIFWYKRLSKYLSNAQSVYAIQDPGIDKQELLFNSLEEMATCYMKAIQKIQPRGPYFLAGASFGANVCFEIARQLKEKGESIKFIGLIDGSTCYPGIFSNQDLFEKLMREQYGRMHLQFLDQGIIDTEFLLKLQTHRKDMLLNYKIPILDNKLTLFKAMELWPAFLPLKRMPMYGWENYSSQPIDVYSVPGNHETMFWEPHVQVLAKQINYCLNELDTSKKALTGQSKLIYKEDKLSRFF